MDDWGAEELNKRVLPTTSSNTSKTIVDINTATMSNNSTNEKMQSILDNNNHFQVNKDSNCAVKEDSEDSLEIDDGKEKADATPENLKKIDDVILTSTTTTYCVRGDDENTNVLGGKPKTTIENKKLEDNSTNDKNINSMNHNKSLDYANNKENRSSIKISNQKIPDSGSEKIFVNKINIGDSDFEDSKTDVAVENELKIVELDDLPKADENKSSERASLSACDDSQIKQDASSATSQNSLAFTIDFGSGSNNNNPNIEAKYKSMMERFQNRHKRGASMSKLEVTKTIGTCGVEKESKKQIVTGNANKIVSNSNLSSNSIINKRTTNNLCANDYELNKSEKGQEPVISESSKVKMRIRDRSASGIRDPAKRHSWSPRTSAIEQDGILSTTNKSTTKTSKLVNSNKTSMQNNQQPPNDLPNQNNLSSKISAKTYSILSSSSYSQVNPALKNIPKQPYAMKVALEKIDFICQQPPLDDFNSKTFQTCGSDDVSEAGTYTLDGDNYTEEQKELMNIDNTKSIANMQHTQSVVAYDVKMLNCINRPTDLPIQNKISEYTKQLPQLEQQELYHSGPRKNILEVNYLHESAVEKPKISYLDKFKSRMKSKKSPEKLLENNKITAPASSPSDGDVGRFTSITTSGVLAKKSSLDPKPKLVRKSSLTTSQIDSSEYISTSSLGSNIGGNKITFMNKDSQMSHSFTDHQKAEYRLNIFTNQTDTQLIMSDYDTVATPDSPKNIDLPISDTAVLKTAQTKNDWIQEWARNARARSVTSCVKPTDHINTQRVKLGSTGSAMNPMMSRSYNCDYVETNNSVFSDSADQGTQQVFYNKPIERFKSHAIGDYGMEYSSSDPNVSRRSTVGSPQSNLDSNIKANFARPPLSPSKIPSPLHSIGRTRSISKTRSSLQDLSPSGVKQQQNQENDFYLQKINSAALGNQSRKSSNKSLNSSNQSPKRYAGSNSVQHYSADEYSPPGHHLGNPNILRGDNSSGLHRRNLSFDYRTQNVNGRSSGINQYMSQSYSNEMNNFVDYLNEFRLPRPRKNSFDSTSFRSHQQLSNSNQLPIGSSPIRQGNFGALNQHLQRNSKNIDQTYSIKQNQNQINKRQVAQQQQSDLQQQNSSPLRRSSSFSAKPLSSSNSSLGNNRFTPLYKTITPGAAQKYVSAIAAQQQQQQQLQQKQNIRNPLQKSASSNSFRKIYSDYDDSVAYYINDEDDLEYCSSEDFDEPYDDGSMQTTSQKLTTSAGSNEPPLTNTRYNKALLMRIERSKQKVAGNSGTKPAPGGVMACPNTPEMPRRSVQSANSAQQQQRSSMRQSVPRDSSLNRLKGDVPHSLASAKKQILQTASKTSTTQPRYMDISKYKPAQGATFLKKDETKSTLQKQPSTEFKKSPSNTTGLSRTDPTRISNRSVKSVGSCSGRPVSASNKNTARDSSVSKQKEMELEMWRRRAKYDPMKAAAEDKRKKEEAKRLSQGKASDSSPFLRSHSYHYGVVGLATGDNTLYNRWIESSDEEEAYISSSTTTTN